MVKFEVTINDVDSKSDISEVPDQNRLNVPGMKELYEHKQDKKTLRNDAKYFWNEQMKDDKDG